MSTSSLTLTAELPAAAAARPPMHPVLFALLVLPKGLAFGYVEVTLGYLLARAGVPVEQIAALAAAALLPYVFKFLWAPLIDTTLTLRKWYGLSVGAAALVLAGMSLLPINQSSLPLLTLGVYVLHTCLTISSIAVPGLMATNVPAAAQGRASGFYSIGHFAGKGLGGGLALLLAQRLAIPGLAGVLVGIVGLACILPLRAFRDQPATVRAERLPDTYRALGRDVWGTIRQPNGWLGLVLCVLPFSCYTASSLWAAVAPEWHAGGTTVALVTGVLATVATAAGSVAGGWVSDRFSARYLYFVVGFVAAFVLIIMAYAPRTEAVFVGGTLLYALLYGVSTAVYVKFLLETIGTGAVATKYTLLASVGNLPSYLLVFALGYAHTHFGSVGMLNTEFVFAVLSLLVYLMLQRTFARGHRLGWRTPAAAFTAPAPPTSYA